LQAANGFAKVPLLFDSGASTTLIHDVSMLLNFRLLTKPKMMGPTGPQAINQVHRRFVPRNAEHDRQVEIVVKDYDHDPSLQYNWVSVTDI